MTAIIRPDGYLDWSCVKCGNIYAKCVVCEICYGNKDEPAQQEAEQAPTPEETEG